MRSYWPKHRPQLNDSVPTAALDCGTRAVQMALDDASGGTITPSISRIRTVMQDWDETNYSGWDKVIDALGAKKGIRGEKTDRIEDVRSHLEAGLGVIWAVSYASLRRAAPRKTGSESFNGGHAIYTRGFRDAKLPPLTRSFDSLLDGRYRGCPNGPVWLSWRKVRDSALRIASDVGTPGRVYCLLVYPDDSIGGIDVDPWTETPPMTLTDVISDLRDSKDRGKYTDRDAERVIASLEYFVGAGNADATARSPIEDPLGLSA